MSYRSMRQLGRKAERTVTIHLPTRVSSKARGIVYEVFVAGKRLTQRLAPSQGGVVTYAWDGRDAYGRPYQGGAPVTVRMGLVYRPVMAAAAVATGGRSFADGTHGSSLGILARYDESGPPHVPPDGIPVLESEVVAWRTWT